MPGKKRECNSCRKLMRSDNLKNHEKICTGGSKSDTFKKISVMMEPPTKKTKEPIKNGVSEVNPPISIAQLRSNAHTSSNSLRTNEELLENLMQLIYEIDENASLKQKMLAILKQLSKATRSSNDFDKGKSDDDTNEIKNEKQNSDEDDTMDETDDEYNIYDLITKTASNLTKNLRENLDKLLLDIDFGYFDEKIRKMIKDFLEGKENDESITEMLRNDLDSLKIKMIVNEISRVRKKVKEVLQRLSDVHDSDVIKTLESLKLGEQITDEQFKRMAMVENNLESFAKAMEGTGIWLGKR